MQTTLIAKENIPYVFRLVARDVHDVMIKSIMEDRDINDVFRELQTAESQLWLATDETDSIQGWLITYVKTMLGGRRIFLDMLGGKTLEELIPSLEHVVGWAKDLGVTEIVAIPRPGLAKHMKKLGFKTMCEVVVRPITGSIH